MARILPNNKFKNLDNTGFGVNSANEGGRLANKDGTSNLKKTGLPFLVRTSMYHSLLRMPRWSFFGSVFLFYTTLNLFFATLYCINGVDKLHGVEIGNDPISQFLQAFFFSSQTLTTVGYGHISPVGIGANIIASLESFFGILSFALVTGLLYGRFTRPRAYLKFSENFLVAPYKGGKGFMLRVASFKNNHLTDVEATVTAAVHVQEGDQTLTRFYQLPLEFSKIASLALSWTIVHNLDENSPFSGWSEADIKESRMELIVAIKAFDDHFSNIVQQRTSYTAEEMVYGAKFLPVFHRNPAGSNTILELDKLNAHEAVALPEQQQQSTETNSLVSNA